MNTPRRLVKLVQMRLNWIWVSFNHTYLLSTICPNEDVELKIIMVISPSLKITSRVDEI